MDQLIGAFLKLPSRSPPSPTPSHPTIFHSTTPPHSQLFLNWRSHHFSTMVQKYTAPVRVYKYPFELVMTVSWAYLKCLFTDKIRQFGIWIDPADWYLLVDWEGRDNLSDRCAHVRFPFSSWRQAECCFLREELDVALCHLLAPFLGSDWVILLSASSVWCPLPCSLHSCMLCLVKLVFTINNSSVPLVIPVER